MALESGMMAGWTEQTDGRKQADGLTGKKMQESKKEKGKLYLCLFLLLLLLLTCAHGESSRQTLTQQEFFFFFHLILFAADRQLITNTEKENNF